MEIRRAIISRLAIIYFLMFLMGVAIVFKLIAIQNIQTERWKQIAENLSKVEVLSKRLIDVMANRTTHNPALDGNIIFLEIFYINNF